MEELKTTLVDYGAGIFAIDQQMVRAFLVVGTDAALLIDAGAKRVDILSLISSVTDLPLTVVLTHSDGDHTANLAAFPEAFVHEADAPAVCSQPGNGAVHLRPLTEGQCFALGGRTLEVLFSPGHTPGSICLLDRENGLLFSGDTVSLGPVFMFGPHRSLPDYLETLRALRRQRDEGVFRTVYCSHNVCPISADTLDPLIACAGGILDGTIAGSPAPMPMPSGEKVLLGRCGECGILFQ